MTTIRNARIEGTLWLHPGTHDLELNGCLFTPGKATKRQLVRWYWQRVRMWFR